MQFQLKPASGTNLSASNVSVDLSGASALWFDSVVSQALGGEFTVTIPFTLSNGSTATTNLTQEIASVTVTATNSVGNSNSIQVPVQ
jgi:hypothetical protein